MRDLQELRGLGGIAIRVEGAGLRGPLDREPSAPEHEQVEVELAGAPARARLTAEGRFETLQLDEQRDGPGLRVGAGRHVEGDGRVPEVGLVGHPDGGRRIEARDTPEARVRQRGKRGHGSPKGRLGIADVGPEPDVRPNPPLGHLAHLAYSRRVQPVAVRILHRPAGLDPLPLEGWLAEARRRNATELAARFGEAGATDVRILDAHDPRPFGARLRGLASEVPAGGGLVVLGSGAVPLARKRDLRPFLRVAGSGGRHALANNRYSADLLAIGSGAALADVPDLAADNAVPRWLDEVAGYDVRDLRSRWRLALDLDSPLDAYVVDPGSAPAGLELTRLVEALAGLRRIAADRRSELLIAGRTSARTLRWLERRTASRTRALVEERGLRASTPDAATPDEPVRIRPPRSVVGQVLDVRGPESFGSILAELGDAAVIDTRVLLAHRLGTDESAWPGAEDRFASDLLLADRIVEPWLRALTASAAAASIPILLGGHTLVGPGLRRLLDSTP